MKEVKLDTFQTEWSDTLHTLKQMNAAYAEFQYFLHLAEKQSDKESIRQLHPKVILLGYSFPDEIIRAMNVAPCYLLGGSFSSAVLAESLVPRDTDSAIKCILGMLTDEELHLADDAVILLPLTGDSMRKLPDMMGTTMKVVPFEVPCDRESPLQRQRFQEEVLRVTFEVEKHLKRPLSKKALLEQCRISEHAARIWTQFHAICNLSAVAVSGSAKLLIANSYHWCEDKAEWAEHLEQLNEEILSHQKSVGLEMPHHHVMLLGSPIYAPNYKVPFLVEEMGLELYSIIHPDISHLTSASPCIGNRNAVIRELAERYLDADMSPAFIHNQMLSDSVEKALEQGNIHGIIVHILKGQIEYDFELNRLEKWIAQYQIPIFRLETDYNYQDVEQLRIRLEAFAEMLRHRSVLKQSEVSDVKKAI